MNKKIRNSANEIIRKYQLKDVNVDSLSEIITKLGYTLVLFNKCANNDDVETILNNLNLQEYILSSRGFTYTDSNYRLVFLNECLNDEESVFVLAHEIGHIVFNHVKAGTVIGNDVQEEYEANEFVHYLLNPPPLMKLKNTIATHKKLVICVAIVLIITLIVSIVFMRFNEEQTYHGEYYVTTSGHKYHREECIYVKYKNNTSRLSKEDFEKGLYDACDVCLPDDND